MKTGKPNVVLLGMNNTQLSTWWRTPSAKAACERGQQLKKQHNAKRLAVLLAKKEKLRKDVENWKEVK